MLSTAAHLHPIYSLNLDFYILSGTSGITDNVNVSITRSPHGLGINVLQEGASEVISFVSYPTPCCYLYFSPTSYKPDSHNPLLGFNLLDQLTELRKPIYSPDGVAFYRRY